MDEKTDYNSSSDSKSESLLNSKIHLRMKAIVIMNDARKMALDMAVRTTKSTNKDTFGLSYENDIPADILLGKAEKIYQWLIKDLEGSDEWKWIK